MRKNLMVATGLVMIPTLVCFFKFGETQFLILLAIQSLLLTIQWGCIEDE